MHYPATRQNKNHKLLNSNGPLSKITKKKMQAYVNEFKEKKEKKKKKEATNEFYKRERERDGDLHKNQNY